MQTKKSYTSQLQKTTKEILLTVWKRWDTDKGLSPKTGKRRTDRGTPRQPSVQEQVKIYYKPRPFIRVKIGKKQITALLDSGSEISCINQNTAQLAKRNLHRIKKIQKTVNLANGSTANITGTTEIPIKIGKYTYQHTFYITPDLDCEALIGIDL